MDANQRNLLKDRSWMNYNSASDRRKPEYESGVNTFLDFAFSNAASNDKIRCPCVNCYLGSFHDRKVVFYHLLARGIIKDYNPWTQHGEDEVEDDEPIPCETHIPVAHEEHLPTPRVENNVGSSRQGKFNSVYIRRRVKGKKAIHLETDEDRSSPITPCIENNVRSSHQEKFNSGDIRRVEKENQAIHLESDEDTSSPIVPPNVWDYVNNAIGMSKTDAGGDVHQENDDDNGDPDLSMSEDNNFAAVDNCDSSPNQSRDDADFVATEAEQVIIDAYSSEAPQAQNSENGKVSNVRCRRPRGLKWKKELKKSTERVKVELPAKVGRVVGPNARQFVVEANWLLKETLPPNVIKWRDLNPNDVAKLLDKVKDRFIFPNESHVDKALLWQFKQWYRIWRSDMRRSYFNKYDTYDEQIAHRPPDIKKEHWKWLVDYWCSEKFKNMSTINRRVRSNTNGYACVGAMSIAKLAYEMEMNKSNQDPTNQTPVYLKLYEKQKRKVDKTWITEEAEEGYNKLLELHQKQVEEHGVDNLSPSEAYAKTFTKAKSINLLGLGENPIALDSSSSFKRRRTGCSDQRVIDASVHARRLELESAQKLDHDEEERTGQGQSDKKLHSEMREKIRLIRQDVGGDVHQGNNNDDDDNGDPDVPMAEDNNFVAVDNCDSSPNQSCDNADFVATEAEQVTAEGYSSESPQVQNSENGIRRRRPRGLKWKIELKKSTERVKVELPAKVGRVVGPNARQFVVEANWLLKETLPPNAISWKHLNTNDIAKLLDKVKNRFIFPNESHVDTALLWQFKQWYRIWRSDMRRSCFNKYDTYDEQIAHRPPNIKKEHWKWLVDYWCSEKFKNMSAINRRVRSSTKGYACVGATSIARLAYEMETNQSNQDPTDQTPVYLKLYEKQKRKMDKTWITEEAEEGYNKLVVLHQKQVEEHGVDNLSPSEAYAKTFTKAKSINLLGVGENPIALDSSSSFKRRRTGCSDQKIIDASVRARRLEIESAQKSDDDEEERSGQGQSDKKLHSEMREKIRLIRQGLGSSSANKA